MEHQSPVDRSGGSLDNINEGSVLLAYNDYSNDNQSDGLQRERLFSSSLAGSVTDINYILFVLFSVNVLFRLNEILTNLLSYLSIIFFFFFFFFLHMLALQIEQQWYSLTHSSWDMRVCTFPRVFVRKLTW